MQKDIDILQRLEQEISRMTKSQKKVAGYILENPMQVAFSTIDQLAHTIGVSTTTVVRFALFFEYTGFAAFQKDLQEVMQSRTQPVSRLEASYKSCEGNTNRLVEAMKLQLQNIEETAAKISMEDVEKAADYLNQARYIYIYGTRSGYCIANYLEHNINRILNNVSHLSDHGGRMPERLMRIGEGDVLLVISMPRYVQEVVTVAEVAKAQGARIISISDGILSPMWELADLFFGVPNKSDDFHNAMTPAMFLCELLISALSYKNRESLMENLQKAEQIMRKLSKDTFYKDR